MRRSALLVLVFVCLGAATAGADPGGRVVDKTYQAAEVQSGGSIRISSGVTFRTRAAERFVEVTIEDATGATVPGRVTQDADGDGENEVEAKVCGATDGPVEIRPGVPVTVWMETGTCNGGTEAGTWTQGTMTATFFR